MDCHRGEKRLKRLGPLGLSVFALVLAVGPDAWAQRAEPEPLVRIDSIYVRNDSLFLDLTTRGIINRELIVALTRGATSALTFELQLWRVRRFWPDALVTSRSHRAKLYFEPLEIAYAVSLPDTSPPIFVDLGDLDGYFRRVRGLLVTDQVARLERGRYYCTATVVVEPLAVESYEELKRWISGEAEELARSLKANPRSDRAGPPRKNRLFRLLLNLTGFGDHAYGTHSDPFALPR